LALNAWITFRNVALPLPMLAFPVVELKLWMKDPGHSATSHGGQKDNFYD
jgi:hypothetical protein